MRGKPNKSGLDEYNPTHKLENHEDFKEEDLHNKNWFFSMIELIKQIYKKFYSIILPDLRNYPLIGFLLIIFITFIHTSITIQLIQFLSVVTHIKASFLGMTLISWAGSIGDTINATVAAKLRAADLLTTSILGSQVVNLQICLGLPWLISILNNEYYGKPTLINFEKKSPLKYLLPLFIIVLGSIFIMTFFNVNLNKKSGVCLIILYFAYLFLEIDINII
jgi:Ca2+/Na+ antiporter